MFRVCIKEITPIKEKKRTPDLVMNYIIESFNLDVGKLNPKVFSKILEILLKVRDKREYELEYKGLKIKVKNGGVKVDDLLKIMKIEKIKISKPQFYKNYINRLVDMSILTKKQGGFYSIKYNSLTEALKYMKKEIEKILDIIQEHADYLETTLSQNV